MISLQPCKICNRESQGIHFGVPSCRACSAFFRRRAGSEELMNKECMNSKCGNNFFKCKPCRLKQCYAAGMNEKKFQFDRDALKSTEAPIKMPRSFDKFVGRPQFVHFCNPEAPSSSIYIDLTVLIEKGEKILKSTPKWTPHIERGPLQKLASYYNVFERMPRNMTTNTEFSSGDCSDSWEFHFLATAKWLSTFDEFQNMDHNIKMKILLGVWHMWARLDRIVATAVARRRGLLVERTEVAQSNGLFVDVNTLDLDVSWVSNYKLEEVAFFVDCFRDWDLIDVIPQFIELNPSSVELNYMMAQMCFHYAGNRFQGEILEIMERFQQILSDDLHNYYVNYEKKSKYSVRLSKLLKINNAIQESVRKRREITKLAKTFNIFAAEFSHPDMFEDTGF